MKKNFVLLTLLFFIVGYSYSQHLTNHLWTKIGAYQLQDTGDSDVTGKIEADRYKLDIDKLRRLLKEVPVRHATLMRHSKMPDSKIIISFPNANGEMESYRIIETPVFHPDLSARYPDIKSYKGISIEDPTAIIGFSLSSEKGFSSMILYGTNRSVFIEPHDLSQSTYNLIKEKGKREFECLTEVGKEYMKKTTKETLRRPYERFPAGRRLRTYRLAVSTNAVYTIYHGGTIAYALAAINTTLTRVNLIFERDLAVFLQLIANNEDVIFTNPETDPYDGSRLPLGYLLQRILTNTIGEANYDVGHLFSGVTRKQINGNAGCIGCVCVDKIKGSGFTKGGPPEGYAFDIVVTHELGHQFGASHTFTHKDEKTKAQLEPGSGSTIMGYAGITGSLTDVQAHTDDYFHFVSIEQILDYIFTTKCFTQTAMVTNFPPTADAGADYTIPHSTAFVLRGSGTDPNPEDILTYCWEQADQGMPDNTLPHTDNVEGPLFRSHLPSFSPNRYMPVLGSVFEGRLTTKWETVSSVGRTMNFSLTVRDNVFYGGGQISNDRMVVTVAENAGPFRVTSQEKILKPWYEGDKKLVTWDIANTREQPVNCQKVNILLTTDEGITFTTLAANTLNDGSEYITIPVNVSTTTKGRIWVEAADNIFYAVNSSDITIKENPGFNMSFIESSQTTCDVKKVVYTFKYLTDHDDFVFFRAEDLPPGTTATFEPSVTSEDNTTVRITISSSSSIEPGQYKIKIYGTTAITKEERESIIELNAYASDIENNVALLSPEDGANNLLPPILFSWTKSSNVDEYIVEVSTDAEFDNIIETSNTLTTTSYLSENIIITDQISQYYWRLMYKNPCAEKTYSTVNDFKTGPEMCDRNYISTDVGQEIIDASSPVISSIHIPASIFSGIVNDINVTLDITHTWDADLIIYLINPEEKKIVLTANNGKSGDNYTNTVFDDDADTSITEGTPPFTGTFSPQEPLSTFNGGPIEGEWKLLIEDVYAKADRGILNSWSLDVCAVPNHKFWMTTLSSSQTVCLPNSEAIFNFTCTTYNNGFSEEITFSAINLPDGVMASFKPQTVIDETSVQLTLDGIDGLAVGAYPFSVVGTSASLTETMNLTLNVYSNVEAVSLQLPQDGTYVGDDDIVHQWEVIEGATSYVIEIATDTDFENIVETATVSTNTYTVSNIGLTGKTYYWRVKPLNDCYGGKFSETYSYMRLGKSCNIYHSTDVPKDIVNLTISNINNDLNLIKDKNVDISVTLDITHTWVGDLTISLASPQQNTIILAKNVGVDGDNFTNTTFDDSASVFIGNGIAPFTGDFVPAESFSNFDGENLKGDWRLLIKDVLREIDVGVLNSWSVELCYADTIVDQPIAKCKDIRKYVTKSDTISVSPSDIDAGSYGMYEIVDMYLDKTSFACEDIGDNEVTLTVVDELGNIDSCMATVTILPKKDTIYSTVYADSPATICFDGVFDICNEEEFKVDICEFPSNGTVTPIISSGCIEYTPNEGFTGMDEVCVLLCPSGLSCDTTIVLVAVIDQPLLVAKCKDIRRYVTKSDTISVLPSDIDAGSYGMYEIDDMYLDKTSFTCEDIGDNEVTLTVVDELGNIDSCMATMTILPKKDTIYSTVYADSPATICFDGVFDICNEEEFKVGICEFPSNGTVIPIIPSGCIEYTPNEGFTGMDEVCVLLCPSGLSCDTTIVLVEVIDQPLLVAKCKDIRRYVTKSDTISVSPSDIDAGSYGMYEIDDMYLDKTSFTCEDIGDNEVTLTVVDELGNIDSCMATMTILPKKDTIYSTVYADSPATICFDGVFDICNEEEFKVGICEFPSNGTVIPIIPSGCIEYTPNEGFTGMDEVCVLLCPSGLSCDTTIVLVEVIDQPLLVAKCKDIRRYVTKSDTISVSPSDIDAGSYGMYEIDDMYLDKTSFTCEDIGDNEVTLTVVDELGNIDSCMATMTILPKKDTIYSTVYADSPATICFDGVFDICNEEEFKVGICEFPSNGTVIPIIPSGCIEYTPNEGFTGMDEVCVLLCPSGLSCDTTIVLVEVIDQPLLVAKCKDIRRYVTKSDTISVSPSDIDAGSYGMYEIDDMYLDKTSFTCEDIGDNEVTLTVVDELGNIDSCMATMTILPKKDTIYSTVYADSPATICFDGVFDICNEEEFKVGICEFPSNGTVIPIIPSGCIEYTPNEGFTGMDEVCVLLCPSGLSCDTTIVLVEVIDQPLLVAKCKDIRRYVTKSDTISVSPSDIDAGSYGMYEIDDMYLDKTSFTCEDIGDNEVTLTVVDELGNIDSCMATMTILPKKDTIYSTVYADSPATICFDGVFDICNEEEFKVGICEFPSNGTVIPIIPSGCIEYTPNEGFTGMDEVCVLLCPSGLSCDTTIVLVEVIDQPLLVAKCKDIRRYVTKSDTISVSPSDIDAGSYGMYEIDDMYLDKTSFTCEDIGDNEVTLTVVDELGNIDSCMATMTILPKKDTIYSTVYADSPATICFDGVFDICNEEEFKVGICEFPSNGTVIPIIPSGCIEYTPNEGFTGMDEVCVLLCPSGLSCDTTIVLVEVIDQPLLVAKCKDIRRYVTKSDTISVSPSDIDAGSYGMYEIDDMYLDKTSFTCEDIGDNEVTLTVVDELGNIDSCMATMTILPKKDTIYSTVYADSPATICFDGVFDICNEEEFKVGICEFPSNGTVIPIIPSGCIEYTPNEGFTGMDEVCVLLCPSGLSCDTTIVLVAVIDQPLLVAKCKDIRRYVTKSDTISVSPSDIDAGSYGMYEIDDMYLDKTSFTCEDIGDNEVTLTVVDELGNIDSCMATMTILPKKDTIYSTVYADSPATICFDGVFDICNEEEFKVGICEFPSNGTVIPIIPSGCIEYTPNEGFTGMDEVCVLLCPSGLSCDTTIVLVAVIDQPLLVAKCKDIRRYVTKSDTISVSPSDIDAGSYGMYEIDDMYLDKTSFTCEDIGDNEVTLTVVDELGNIDSCMATMTILPKKDTIYHTIQSNETASVCVDDVTDFCEEPNLYEVRIVKLPSNGTLSFLSSCAIYMPHEGFNGIEEMHFVSVSTNDVRDTTVVFIGVIDRPVAKCKDIRRYITKTETISISPDDINNSSSGVHGIDTMYLDASSFTCENIGNNEVTLTVKDTLGNIESCMATVTILPKKDTIYQTIKVNTTTAVCTDEVTDFCEVVYGIEIIKYPSNGVFSIWFYCGYYTPYKEFTNGVEEIHFVSINANGVRDTTVVFIEVSSDFDVSTMFIPQLLTPNEDGLNDRWAIPYLKDHSSSYKENRVTVFTGTGRIIYDKKNYGKEGDYWDGYYRGERVSEGIYYYHIMIDGDRKNARTGYIYIRW